MCFLRDLLGARGLACKLAYKNRKGRSFTEGPFLKLLCILKLWSLFIHRVIVL